MIWLTLPHGKHLTAYLQILPSTLEGGSRPLQFVEDLLQVFGRCHGQHCSLDHGRKVKAEKVIADNDLAQPKRSKPLRKTVCSVYCRLVNPVDGKILHIMRRERDYEIWITCYFYEIWINHYFFAGFAHADLSDCRYNPKHKHNLWV